MSAATLQRTRDMLAKHHRDGERFADLMKESYASRFNDQFWQAWQQFIEPVLSPTPTVIDLGSGPGMFIRDLAGRYNPLRAIAVECADYMLGAMGELPAGCEVAAEDLHDPHLPLADGEADAAVASVVIHEMHQPVRALREVHRCLKPGGRFYILDWVRTPLTQYIEAEADEGQVFDPATSLETLEDLFIHFTEHNRFAIDDLVYLLEKTGFAIIDKTPMKEGRFVRLVAEKR